MAKKGRILSGMRPTGRLHLGNYTGALENWVKLQDEFENYHLIADWHMLTTNLDTSKIKNDILDMVIDWIGGGINPEKSPVFVQSSIKEHAELHLIFSMLVTVARLERNPTVKEQVRDLNIEERIMYGHLGYPVLQAADILLYRADLVPVGEDQLPHIEITREIARKFNDTYGEVFPVPKGKVTQFARMPGTDGKRMSKSIGNTILLTEEPDDVWEKLKKAFTDPKKIRKNDPGNPDICLIQTYQEYFDIENAEETAVECKKGSLGCVEHKKNICEKITEFIEPFRKNREYYLTHMDTVKDILKEGTQKAKIVAENTMQEAKEAMKLWQIKDIT